MTKPRLISGNLNEVFNTAISIIFCTPVQRLRSSYFFCVHSDHLGSRYELSAFKTLQSSVSRQEEVQGHESVHSKFCNSRVFSEDSLPSSFNYWQRNKSFKCPGYQDLKKCQIPAHPGLNSCQMPRGCPGRGDGHSWI